MVPDIGGVLGALGVIEEIKSPCCDRGLLGLMLAARSTEG
jgi:hypothetical protein